ncbi:MAG: type II toxin-antitoxin system Phd/YefM family antitoxin [Rhodothermales bacterium]|jgi:prevent-host-death family protein
MYLTKGIDAIATITELRSNTSELLEYAKDNEQGILIQKNNQPYAVLISWELYDRLLASEEASTGKQKGGKTK